MRTALSLLFSGLLLTAIITSVFLFIREEINREVETGYDSFGKYDLILSGIPDDIKNELIPSDLTFTHETVTVPGKAGFYGKEYNYGYTDKACDLLHVPMKNGSMPVSENEAAVEQSPSSTSYNPLISPSTMRSQSRYSIRSYFANISPNRNKR